jgi:hypothetical protein
VQGDAVTQIAHDVVAVGPEADDNRGTAEGAAIVGTASNGKGEGTYRIQYGTSVLEPSRVVFFQMP